MHHIEAKVLFEEGKKFLARELITDLFLDMGLQGVAVEDPDEQPEEDWGAGAVPPPEAHAVIGFFPKDVDAVRTNDFILAEIG